MSKFSVDVFEEQLLLRSHLNALRAVDVAHQSGQISSMLRYHILQSLFPAVEDRKQNAIDFRTCHTCPLALPQSEQTSPRAVADTRTGRKFEPGRQVFLAEFEVAN